MIPYFNMHLRDFTPVLYRNPTCTQVGYRSGPRVLTSDKRIHKLLMTLEDEPSFIPSTSVAQLLTFPAGQVVVQGLLQAGLLTYSPTGTHRQRWMSRKRSQWRLLLLGFPRYGPALVEGLRTQGWKHIDVCDPSRVESAGELTQSIYLRSQRGLSRERIAQGQCDTGIFDPGLGLGWDQYDFVLMSSSHVMAPQWYRQLLAEDIPHLAVIESADQFWGSAITYPGRVRCLVCREHQLIKKDPGHVLLASQLFAYNDDTHPRLQPEIEHALLAQLLASLRDFHPSYDVYCRLKKRHGVNNSQPTKPWILNKDYLTVQVDDTAGQSHCGCLELQINPVTQCTELGAAVV